MALLRFDTQVYGPGLLAFDVQTYQAPAGLATSQNAFIDLFILTNGTQAYTPAPTATVQSGVSALTLTASAAQNYAPANNAATVQTGVSALTLTANATQAYAPVVSTQQSGASMLTLTANATQVYTEPTIVRYVVNAFIDLGEVT